MTQAGMHQGAGLVGLLYSVVHTDDGNFLPLHECSRSTFLATTTHCTSTKTIYTCNTNKSWKCGVEKQHLDQSVGERYSY